MKEKLPFKCPKCGCENSAGAAECAKCGIIFSKYEDMEIRKDIYANAPVLPGYMPAAGKITSGRNTIILLVIALIAAVITGSIWYYIISRGVKMYGQDLDRQANIR